MNIVNMKNIVEPHQGLNIIIHNQLEMGSKYDNASNLRLNGPNFDYNVLGGISSRFFIKPSKIGLKRGNLDI